MMNLFWFLYYAIKFILILTVLILIVLFFSLIFSYFFSILSCVFFTSLTILILFLPSLPFSFDIHHLNWWPSFLFACSVKIRFKVGWLFYSKSDCKHSLIILKGELIAGCIECCTLKSSEKEKKQEIIFEKPAPIREHLGAGGKISWTCWLLILTFFVCF